jgi:hypothetical protein
MTTAFEKFLVEKGYVPHRVDFKTNVLTEITGHYFYSSTGLGSILFVPKDGVMFEKIQKKDFDSITSEDVLTCISFGLGQVDSPPTLLYPRPRICVLRDHPVYGVLEGGEGDDQNMTHVLETFPFETIFEAMFDKFTVFLSDLTESKVLTTTSNFLLGVRPRDRVILNPK